MVNDCYVTLPITSQISVLGVPNMSVEKEILLLQINKIYNPPKQSLLKKKQLNVTGKI